jgi:hypothetical protein
MMTAAKSDSKKPEATKAVTPTATPVAAQPTTAPKAEVVGRQQITLDKLRLAWTERKVDLSKMTVTADGKFLNVKVGEGWPMIQIGTAGGIDIPAVKSFPKAWDAALIANELFAKQTAREAKKTATPAPKAAVQPEAKKAETPTQKKQRVGAEVESKLQSASA